MGTPYALKYNGTLYYYVTNLQGDILHIVDASGAAVVSYTYSPYGKPLSTTGTLASTLGVDNPLRYRGYYYDTDSGLYYLQSRYYDPELGRFINADSYVSTGQGLLGHNMFAYCLNNPINHYDACGHCALCLNSKIDSKASTKIKDTCGGGGAVFAVLLTAISATTALSINEVIQFVSRIASDVRLYAKTLMDYSQSMYENQQPRIHHVIPKGDFSKYGTDTKKKLNHMHALLSSVQISIDDPENLVVISHGAHKSMHTKDYIDTISEIMSNATMGDERSIRMALFYARIYASSLGQYPLHYR